MKKEQFKKSILEIVNYYLGQMVQANLAAQTDNEQLLKMVESQVQISSYNFEVALDELINKAFPERRAKKHED